MIVGITDIKTETGEQNPAKEAGLKVGDIILCANGEEMCSNALFKQRVERGEGLSLKCKRNSDEFETTLRPVLSSDDGRFKAGLWVRDSSGGNRNHDLYRLPKRNFRRSRPRSVRRGHRTKTSRTVGRGSPCRNNRNNQRAEREPPESFMAVLQAAADSEKFCSIPIAGRFSENMRAKPRALNKRKLPCVGK